jgi:hypothetical protein
VRTQGRCCRELITHMKLVDTYTNMCFIALLINSYFAINTVQASEDSILSPSSNEDGGLKTFSSKVTAKAIPIYILIVSLLSVGLYLITKVTIIFRLVLCILRNPA